MVNRTVYTCIINSSEIELCNAPLEHFKSRILT